MDSDNRIGEFLRARRELVRPEDVGLPNAGRRRVPGLRREEMALLAGVSADYYTRLEQGRDQHPSEQVVEALARALQLDDDAAAHLRQLAHPIQRRPRLRGDDPTAEPVRPGVQALLSAWGHTPAFVTGRHLDVLGSNPLARALSPMHAVGSNLLRSVFLDPSARDVHPDWDGFATRIVATLRAAVGPNLDEPGLADLLAELNAGSEEFRSLWGRYLVRDRADGLKRFVHPLVGTIELPYETFSVNGAGAEGQILVAYHAEPGSPAARALALLETIAAEEREPSSLRPSRRTAP
jgi:transcriptional regulator with XRE-family HTH domain